MKSLSGLKVFVTGGSGFIGGRLIECLARDCNVNITALVNRPFAGSLRMARFPVNFVFGPMTDRDRMKEAMAGCDVVFHLAYAKGGTEKEDFRITVEGTRVLAEAAADAGVERFVNVSTAAVYGNQKQGIIDETDNRIRWGWAYSDMKLAAENVALEVLKKRGLPVTILQVAGVYGPWGPVFTISPLNQLQSGQVALPGEGKGVSNATYVDDVVQALLLAATNPAAVGEIFIIKGPGRITRKVFYEHYRNMLNDPPELILLKQGDYERLTRKKKYSAMRQILPSTMAALKGDPVFRGAMSESGMLKPLKWIRNLRDSRSLITKQSPAIECKNNSEKQLFLPPALFYAKYLSAETEYSNEKAKELLGFQPAFEVERGMSVTEDWAKWARVIKLREFQE